MYPLPLLTEVA